MHRAAAAVVESLENRWLLSAGDLDSTFATAGFTASTVDTAAAVAKDASGNIVVAGNQFGTGDVIVARYLPGGTLDTSFGDQGKTVIDLGGADTIGAIAIDATGIYLAGAKGTDMALARLSSTGALDYVTPVNLGAGITDSADAIAIASDGIYIGGTASVAGQNEFAVAKFTAAGAPVGSFGSDGAVTTAFGTNAHLTALVADGADVIAGGYSAGGSPTSFTLARYGATQWTQTTDYFQGADSQIAALQIRGGNVLAIGSANGLALAQYSLVSGGPDVSFNTADPTNPSSYVDSSVAGLFTVVTGGLDGTGGLIVAGTKGVSEFATIRYTFVPSPTRDGDYGGSGMASSDLGDASHAHKTAAATVSAVDGTTVLVGKAFAVDQGSNFGGAILDGTGGVTATFNTDFTGPTTDQGTAAVTDSAGRTIVAGTKNRVLDDGVVLQHVVLVRYTTAGAIDTSFGVGGSVEVSFGTRTETFQSLALDASGRILVAGLDASGGIKVNRYLPGGALDTGNFAAGGTLTITDVVLVDTGAAIRVAADGDKVVVVGTTSTDSEDFYVRRYDSNGLLDGSFNGGNIVTIAGPAPFGNDLARAVLVLSDGTIIVGGASHSDDTGSDVLAIAQVSANGTSVVSAFQSLPDALSFLDGSISALALQGTNVIAAGYNQFGAIVLARFDTGSGNFDNTFGTGGVTTLDALSTEGGAAGVVVDSHNQIGIVSALDNTTGDLIVIRLTADGALDSTFSGDGVASTGIVAGENNAAGIISDAGGNLIVAGALSVTPFNKNIAVQRLLGGYAPVTVNPTVAVNGAPASSSEGTGINLTSNVTEGTGTIVSYTWTVTEDGVAYGTNGSAASFNFTPDDNATYVVTLTVTASDGGTASDAKTINVTNVTPTAAIVGAPTSSTAGTPINLTSNVNDPAGVNDPITYTWTVTKDGNAYGTPGTGATYSFTPADAGTYIVTLTVDDGDGGIVSDTKTITVNPVATGVSATLSGGILTIAGDGAANTINVSLNAAGNYRVVIGTQVDQVFAFAAVNNILIQAGAGNDVITIANGVAIPALVRGGDGDDVILAGGGNDMLFGEDGNDILTGGAGNDVLIGGAGSDILSGGNGRDILVGGLGSDVITGDNGDDILIAGGTTYNNDPVGLSAIRDIWTGGGSYATRVNALKSNLLKPANLFNDGAIDLLSGNNGQDWLIASTSDLWLGIAGSEVVTIV